MSVSRFTTREKAVIEFALAVERKTLLDRVKIFEGAQHDTPDAKEVVKNDYARIAEIDAIAAKLRQQHA